MRLIRKVVPPDDKRRNYLIRKLYQFRDCPQLKDIKRKLRSEISKCDGYTQYYASYKGLTWLIGDENTSKKRLLLYKDPGFVQPYIQAFRKKMRTPRAESRLKTFKGGDYLRYLLVGGVFLMKDTIIAKDLEMRRRAVQKRKQPVTEDFHIGLELEYASKIEPWQVTELIVQEKLHKNLRVVGDRSIEVNNEFPYQTEICVLTKYSELDSMLKRLAKIITPDRFQANWSCGLHVHLDCRFADVARVYQNLASLQFLLFKLASEARQSNHYCRPVMAPDFNSDLDQDHYAAISKSAFREHGSVEVRIHQSTTDFDVIGKWVHLLKRIADYRGEVLECKRDAQLEFSELKDKIKPGDEILKYVEERLAA